MTLPVTDVRSNSNDQIAHASRVIGRSEARRKIFEEIHRGRQQIKTVTQLTKATGLKRQRVLDEARKLADDQIVIATKREGEIAYGRERFYYKNQGTILGLVKNPKKLRAFPTKISAKSVTIHIAPTVRRGLVRTKIVTLDMIDSFAKVRRQKRAAASLSILEDTFKSGVKRIIGEDGRFKDWGGETSDLYTTRLRMTGRKAAAFGFKGKGLKGLLTPARMGRNGDQIPRLFQEDADVFIVQYGGQIAASVMGQLGTYAQVKSLATGRTIFYGTVDGSDSARLVAAYPRAFKGKS